MDEVDTSRLNLKFPPAPRSGDYPIIAEGVGKNYGSHVVFSNATFTIKRGEKVAFVGKNGEGKSTLVKCIMGETKFDIRTKIRDILGAFMFGGEASDKKVKVLSGGEKTRLAMIRLLLEPVNLLILDEPTNHLDVDAKEELARALKAYKGSILLICHEPEFYEGFATRVVDCSEFCLRG